MRMRGPVWQVMQGCPIWKAREVERLLVVEARDDAGDLRPFRQRTEPTSDDGEIGQAPPPANINARLESARVRAA